MAPPPSSGGPSAIGPGISVEQALASDLQDPLLVNGYLVYRRNEEPRLCSALAESHPPQCGEPSLVVDGPELSEFGVEVETAGTTQWTPNQVQIAGMRRGDRLIIEEAHR